MNYIKQLNGFYSTLDFKPLTADAIAVYMILLQIANRTGWIDKFRVANSVLMSKCNLDRQKLNRARNKLVEQGYITYKQGKNQVVAPIYSVIKLYDMRNDAADDTANDTANDTADDTADNTADNTPNDTINKQNKTKQNNEQKQVLLEHFEKIWEIYPNKKGKAKAIEYYLQWINGRKIANITRKLTDKEMYYAASKYAKECDENAIEIQFIKHGDTFFNKAILDYVEVQDGQV